MVTKREVMKCKPGTILKLSWNDSEPSVGLLLEKPVNKPGFVDLFVYHIDTQTYDRHTGHTQVIEILGTISSEDY